MIILKNIIKNYYSKVETVEVLKGIDLTIEEGEFVSIMGPSGVGKSTLLHIMGTLDKPTSGEVWIKNQLIDFSDNEFLDNFRARHVGFIFQFHHLLPEFTALENVLIPTMIRDGRILEKNLRKAKEILDLVEMSHRLNHKPSELSGGEQQRVAIARALVNDPVLLLADEPTGNLDEKHGQEVFELLTNLNKQFKKTMVLVTHNKDLATVANRIIYLHDGRVVTPQTG
jgi:lipoprotein-releasing system ATP-binding protein